MALTNSELFHLEYLVDPTREPRIPENKRERGKMERARRGPRGESDKKIVRKRRSEPAIGLGKSSGRDKVEARQCEVR